MKIYAIRDRLIDYYMTPFAAHEDAGVMAQLAESINLEGGKSGIQQAPHHYELWSLAEVTKEGHVLPLREFIADCASLVRTRRESAGSGETTAGRPLADRKEPPRRPERPADTQAGAVPETAPAEPGAAPETHRNGAGGYEGGAGGPYGTEVGRYPFL